MINLIGARLCLDSAAKYESPITNLKQILKSCEMLSLLSGCCKDLNVDPL